MILIIYIFVIVGLCFHLPLYPILFAGVMVQSLIAFLLTRSVQTLRIGAGMLMANLLYVMVSPSGGFDAFSLDPQIAGTVKAITIAINVFGLFVTTVIGIAGSPGSPSMQTDRVSK